MKNVCSVLDLNFRQELGGSRWQYGGEGKLHSFKSKHDLSEIQKLNFGHSAKDGRENGPRQKAAKSKSKPKLHVSFS